MSAKYAKSTVKLYQNKINSLDKAATKALGMTAEQIHTDIVQSQVMPRDTGALQNEKTFVDLQNINQRSAEIVSEGPYARRLYYHPEFDFNKSENPNAGACWFDEYLASGGKKDYAKKVFKEFYRREAGL